MPKRTGRPAWHGSDRKKFLPPDWAKRRLIRFEMDGWRCVDCGWHDPTGATLECDHVGERTDHRLEQLETRCGRKAPRNCHGRVTGQRVQAKRNPRRQPEQHPGLRPR